MLDISKNIHVPYEEFVVSYSRSGGPGGQNVNKVSSKVLLRWHPGSSPSLPFDVKARFLERHASRLTKEGDLLITSQATRDQGRNFEDCLEKLRAMIVEVLQAPKQRKKTRPSKGSVARRLQAKKHTAQRKQSRGKVRHDD